MSLTRARARPSRCACVVLATSVMLSLALGWSGPATAQQEPVPTPTTPLIVTESDADPAVEPDSPIGEIIPQPNSGAPPERPGDRGGSLQLGLFALLLAFMGVAAWRIAVSGRRGRQAHAARAHSQASTMAEPETAEGDEPAPGAIDESAPPPRAG